MPLTSPGLPQRPAMPCYCAGCSRVRLVAGWKRIKLIGYVGLTLKDTILVKVVFREHKTSIHLPKLPLVYTIIKVCAHKNKPMRPKVSCTNTYVCCAGPKTVKLTPTHKLNVAGVQKTNKPEHAPEFEACPAI